MTKKKPPFRDRSPAAKVMIAVAAAISLGIVGFAERDIQRRPASQIRGRKLAWRIACLNAVPALGYLRWGRRTGA